MLNSNIPQLNSEFIEIVNEFENADKVDISILVTKNDSENCNFQVIVDNVVKNYEYNSVICSDKLIEKRQFKRNAKYSLYNAISTYYGKKLPWGALTGIRPTKLAHQQGEDYQSFLKDSMDISEKKLDLLTKIMQTQKPYYQVSEQNFDFYVGVPFCPTRCQYCSFMSCEIGKATLVNEYVSALCYEIESSKQLVKKLRSVYVGGGTPISLDEKNLEKLLQAVGEVNVEYTVEAGRPDCITKSKLQLLKDYGVTRICVNPQTFNDDTLKLMGRNHTTAQTYQSYELAKQFGFDINMDLIAGLPLESFEVFKDSLNRAIDLSPDNLTVHTLCIKKGSKLKELCSRLPENQIEKMIDYTHERLDECGYLPYYLYRQKYMAGNLENTGYTKPNKQCVYNIDVMEEISQNLACGANAVSKRIFVSENRIERIGAPKDIFTYINKVETIVKDKKIMFNL